MFTPTGFSRVLLGLSLVLGAGASLIALAVLGGTSNALSNDGPPGQIEATGFVLVDQQGRTRGTWTVVDDRTVLSMCDAEGSPRLAVAIGDDATLTLLDKSGAELVKIKATQMHGSVLRLSDESGKSGWFACASRSATFLSASRDPDRDVVAISVGEDGLANIVIRDSKSKAMWTAPSNTAAQVAAPK